MPSQKERKTGVVKSTPRFFESPLDLSHFENYQTIFFSPELFSAPLFHNSLKNYIGGHKNPRCTKNGVGSNPDKFFWYVSGPLFWSRWRTTKTDPPHLHLPPHAKVLDSSKFLANKNSEIDYKDMLDFERLQKLRSKFVCLRYEKCDPWRDN